MTWATILKNLAMSAIPSIIEIGQNFFEKILSAPPMNKNNSVDDIEKISRSLGDLREHVLKESQPTISSANESMMTYFEEQLFTLEEQKDLLEKYEISSRSVEHKLQDINRRLGNFWQDSIYKKISLDNKQCREILTLPSGEKKSVELANFTNEVLADTLKDYSELVKKELGKLYVGFDEEVRRSISRLEQTVRDYSEILQSLDEKDDDRYEKIIAKSMSKVFCYDLILQKVSD